MYIYKSTCHINELYEGKVEADIDLLGEVTNWSNERIVTLSVEQVLDQAYFVVASKTWSQNKNVLKRSQRQTDRRAARLR